jgi:hypothetical protein
LIGLNAHARTVELCLKFIGTVANRDSHEREYDIRNVLEDVTRGPYAMRDRLVFLPVEDWRESEPEAVIRRTLSDLITENTSGIRRWLVTDPTCSQIELAFLCHATIEAVYWQLADKMEAGMVRRCLECRRFFISRDKRQTYRPPIGDSKRSRCSSRLNTKEHRDRQKP